MNSKLFDTLESRTMYSASAPTVAGYLPDWNATPAMIARLDYSTLNTINYFSVDPDSTGYIPGTNGEPAVSAGSGQSLSRLQDAVTAAHDAGLKINIVIGGAGHELAFERIMHDEIKRNTFAQSVKEFCARYDLDGVDFDYEPPGDRGVTPQQVEDYGKLIAAVNEAAPELTMTSAVIADPIAEAVPMLDANEQQVVIDGIPQWLEPNWDVHHWALNAQAIQALDEIGVMAYDFSPGAGNADMTHALETMNDWVEHAEQSGGSREQIVLGLPFYGRSGPSTWGGSGPSGIASYSDIVRGATSMPAPSANSVVSVVADTGPRHQLDNVAATWFYDGPDRIQAKTEAALGANVGGVMIWDVTQDYFNDDGTYNEAHSLMKAVNRGLGATAVTQPAVDEDTHTARILGRVFWDGNTDGVENGYDSGNGWRTVFLDTNDNGVLDKGEQHTQTDADGNYYFELLSAGTYNVRLQAASWTFSTTSPVQQVTLDINEDVFDVSFGECPTYRRR